jgi:predicted nucleic-acid-binding Zn-ribbon protein
MDPIQTRCPKCEGEMVRGFIPDGIHGGQLVSRWTAGIPKKSFWTGTKLVAHIDAVPIGAYRCESCGYLELYARPEFAAQ